VWRGTVWLGRAVIYKDVVTGDELVTDAFDLNVVDDFFYEVDGTMITEGGDEIDIGGNAAEGEEEEGSEAVKICNVVSSGRFQQTSFGKKDYVACYKSYMKVRRAARLPASRSRAFRALELSACVCGWGSSPGFAESCQAPQSDQPGPRRRVQIGAPPSPWLPAPRARLTLMPAALAPRARLTGAGRTAHP